MKDLIENRAKIGRFKKIALALRLLGENGFLWTLLLVIYYGSSHVSNAIAARAFAAGDALRKKRNLPGLNSKAVNKFVWDNWDWSSQGEEWTLSQEWKRSVIKTFMDAYILNGSVILEIGPGAGRWTEALQRRASRLIGVDISEAAVETCQARFADCDNVDIYVGSGTDLRSVAPASVDVIWSFDVFVHINRTEFVAYAYEFYRVLKPGGIGIIQHGTVGGSTGGWRSDVRSDDARDILQQAGLNIVTQCSSWQDNGQTFPVGMYQDMITIFRQPAK